MPVCQRAEEPLRPHGPPGPTSPAAARPGPMTSCPGVFPALEITTQKTVDVLRWTWSREEPALARVAAQPQQPRGLSRRFHTLGRDAQRECVRELHQRRDDLRVDR